ncbi:hypothetical protein [uncultured Alsobacter sp.]|uniref:phage head spike fiber domain-containing protein n=1 Tax=uncultured Alsobacter sp. TaxID=1748258 RepID=UPI0025DF7A3C|nr:hypothetical protein [uncultured Alsobacter sp.]
MTGLELVGFGALPPSGAPLLDGSESDGTNSIGGGIGWFSGGGATLANTSSPAPDGTNTAYTLTEDSGGGRHMAYSYTGTISGGVSASAYLKDISRRYAMLHYEDNSSDDFTNSIFAFVDLVTGTITDSGSTGTMVLNSVTIEAAVGGFYKITMNGTQVNTRGGTFNIHLSQEATKAASSIDYHGQPAYTGDGASSIYVWRPKVVD